MKINTLLQILLLIILCIGIGLFIWTIQSGSLKCKINPISYAEKQLTEKYNEPIYCECSRTPSLNFEEFNFSNVEISS